MCEAGLGSGYVQRRLHCITELNHRRIFRWLLPLPAQHAFRLCRRC